VSAVPERATSSRDLLLVLLARLCMDDSRLGAEAGRTGQAAEDAPKPSDDGKTGPTAGQAAVRSAADADICSRLAQAGVVEEQTPAGPLAAPDALRTRCSNGWMHWRRSAPELWLAPARSSLIWPTCCWRWTCSRSHDGLTSVEREEFARLRAE